MISSNKKTGFTLVELLVVIAILAILLTILAPALQRARQQARLVLCSNNLHQIATGLNLYAVENQSRYMPRAAAYPRCIYMRGQPYDTREMLVRYVTCDTGGLFFCPAADPGAAQQGTRPGLCFDYDIDPSAYSAEDRQTWAPHYFVAAGAYGSSMNYLAGYSLYAGMRGQGSYSWDWSLSGNKDRDREPRFAYSEQDCIASDVQEAWPQYGGIYGLPGQPCRSNHATYFEDPAVSSGTTPTDAVRFESSNAAYADGHVERHNTLEYGLQRVGGDGGLFEY